MAIFTPSTRNLKCLVWCLLILLAGCAPPESETPTAVTPVSTPTTLAAEPITTARPTREPTTIPTLRPTARPQITPVPTEAELWRMPAPTYTSTPTMTPIPPPIGWPKLNHDVLFLVDNSLKLWNHNNNEELEILLDSIVSEKLENYPDWYPAPGEIKDYQVSPDGQSIIVSRVVTIEPFVQEFILIDLQTRENRILVPATTFLWKPSFSPDGRQIAYFIGDSNEYDPEGPETGSIVIQNIYDGSLPITVGLCINKFEDDEISGKGCKRQRIVWSPDGSSLLWSDRRGVVTYSLNRGTTETLLSHKNLILKWPPEPGELSLVRVYRPIDWSPNGRYLRLEAGHYEGGSLSVLDLETRSLFDVPNTFNYDNPAVPYSIWLSDNRLFQIRPEGGYNQQISFVDIWQVLPSTGEWTLDDTIELSTTPGVFSTEPKQLADSSIILAMVSVDGTKSNAGFYRSNPLNGDQIKLEFNPIPTSEWTWRYSNIHWSPDGSGILFHSISRWTNDRYLFYIPVDGSVPYDLGYSLGENVASIHWLP